MPPSLILSCETGTPKMADQQFRALSSCLVITFLMVIVRTQKIGPEIGKFIAVTQLIYELKRHRFYLYEIENKYSVPIELYKHEWKSGRAREVPFQIKSPNNAT